MNIKKAIKAGGLVFAIQFSVMSVLSNTVGPFLGANSWAAYVWQGLMVLLLLAIVYTVSKWYFTGVTINIKNAAFLGLILVIVSFLINLLQIIPAVYFKQAIAAPLMQYVTSVSFLMTTAITIVTAVATGYFMHKKNNIACKVEGAVGNCMPEEETEEK